MVLVNPWSWQVTVWMEKQGESAFVMVQGRLVLKKKLTLVSCLHNLCEMYYGFIRAAFSGTNIN